MEQKITLEAVNDLDKYKQTLALTKANIMLGAMPMDERFAACYNALPACDQLDIDRRAEGLCAEVVRRQQIVAELERFERESALDTIPIAIVGAVVVVLMVVFFVVFLGCSAAQTKPTQMLSSCDDVLYVIQNVKSHIRDVDYDGKVNCCDYAISFKIRFDEICKQYKYYKDDLFKKKNCEIVWNCGNPNGMNHLFVRVYRYDRWWYIEPQHDRNGIQYEMYEVWGDRYDPKYNRYGQTQLWLDTASNNYSVRKRARTILNYDDSGSW